MTRVITIGWTIAGRGEATQLAQLIGACAVALRQLDGGGGALLQ